MILYGKPVAEKIYEGLKKDLKKLCQMNIQPAMAVILVGENLESLSYVKMKEKKAEELDINFKLFHLPKISTEKQVSKLLEELNQNKYISGVIIQLPLPKDFDMEKVLKKVLPDKDIDGFYGNFPAPTARAILEIFKYYKIDLQNKKIIIIGRGRLVGQPLEKILVRNGLKPTVCDSETADLSSLTKEADVIVTATGMPGLIKEEMVSSDAVLIDAGTSEIGGRTVGDVDPEVYKKIKTYTPVPGGVGPVTVACLMKNVAETTKKQLN